jgi:hypothetical protein
MNHSSAINEIALALSKAQEAIQDAEKSSANPFFKTKYADLSSVLNEIRAVFPKNGLALVQSPFTAENGNIGVTTMVVHSSGQWMSDSIDIPAQGKNLAQESGSVITYLRRYSASAFAGIAQADSDANLGTSKASNTAPVVNLKGPSITEDQIQQINDLMLETSTNESAFCQFLGVESVAKIPQYLHDKAVAALTKKLDIMEKSDVS